MSDEEPTRIIRRPRGGSSQGSDADKSITAGAQASSAPADDPEATRKPPRTDDKKTTRVIEKPSNDDGVTQLIRPGVQKADSPQTDLVRGWLVVIDGPGFGQSVEIGTGQNQIGRKTGRIVLDFGDQSISRDLHAVIVYDPDDREFWIEKNQAAANLTSHNGKAIRGSADLNAGDTIKMGATTLKFVPLCGPDFDWEDLANKDDSNSSDD